MSTPIMEVLAGEKYDLLMDALTHYRNHCQNHASRGITGYGSAKEEAKRERWAAKRDKIDSLISLITEETI